jgi:hypothetical protein
MKLPGIGYEALAGRNAANGGHWFDEEARRFFGSTNISPILYDEFFITEDRMPGDVPRYTVRRIADERGTIETIGEYRQFRSRKAAYDEIHALEREGRAG